MRKRKDPGPEMEVGGLFTEEEMTPEPAAPSLEAYQMKICRRDMTDWENLFKGFDEIHVITYSVGLAQVRKVMKFFRTGDIIIGCPSLIQQNTAELFAEQEFSLKTVCENPYLQSRIKDGSFHVYAANRHIHSKEYLLKAEDGRTRLILGSANFSVQAWGGGQKEIYLYEDNSEFFESFMEEYRILLEESSSEIGIQAQPVQEDGSNLTDLPALKKIVETNKALVVEPAPQEETDYCFESERGKKEWEKLVEKSGIRPDPMGKIIIKPKSVIRMESEKRKNYEEKKAQMVINPELFIDYDHKTVSFDGKRWDLAPDVKQVREDISCLYQYIEGCDAFTGDTIQMKKTYWKVLLYMFLSPFMAYMRLEYAPHAPANSVGKYFPMYLILRGPKNGGKSSLIRTGQQFMFGKALQNIPVEDISASKVGAYKVAIKGCPVLFDDVTNARLKYLKDIVKSDEMLLRERYAHHGVFLFTTNDGQTIPASVAKRTVIFSIENQLTEDESVKLDVSLNQLQRKIGNSLYRAFLAQMLSQLDSFMECMWKEEKPIGWFPDIFRFGYEMLRRTIKAAGMELPESCSEVSWKDFMGEYTKSETAMRMLLAFYQEYPDCFMIQKGKDQLRIDFSRMEDKMTNTVVRKFKEELPVTLEPKVVGSVMFVKNSSICEYTGINFEDKKHLLARIASFFKG